MEIVKNDKKVVRGWALFDWANSAFPLVIATAVFPPYFASLAPDVMEILGFSIDSNSLYSYCLSFSFLLVAMMTPFLCGIADYSGRRKFFLKLFTYIGSAACILLYFFSNSDQAGIGLTAFIIGFTAFNASLVFYTSYLPDIVTEDKYDSTSALGYGFGYIGSMILLVMILAMIQFKSALGIDSSTLPVRIGYVLVGIWWMSFAQFTFNALPKDKTIKFQSSFMRKGLNEVTQVFHEIRKEGNVMKFLASYFFFIAGVNVVIYLATIFAQEELGFQQTELIILISLLQILAMVGSFFFAYISGKIGNKWALMIQLVIWVAICAVSYFVTGTKEFYVLALFVGLVFGGIQSLSRSTYTKLLSSEIESLASYFSFYDVLTKVASVAGTLIFGVVNQITGNMRYSILATGIFFLIGMLILMTVKKIEKA